MSEELEAAVAYVTLLAGGKGLQKDTERKVKAVKAPDIIAKIDAQIGDLEKKLGVAREKLAKLKTAGADPQIGLDISALEARAAVVRQRLAQLDRSSADVTVQADVAAAEARLGRITTQIERLEHQRATAHVQAQVQGEQEVRALEQQITRLRQQRATVSVNADGTARARTEVGSVEQAARRLDGKRADVHVGSSGVGDTAGKLLALAAAAGAAASALPAVAAGAAIASGGLGTLAQAAAAGIGAFSGVGDAITAVQAQQKSAGASAASGAQQQVSAARQIASAASNLQQAQTQQARTAIQGNQQVASAARSLQQAQVAADRASIQGAQQVAAARRALAAAQIQAARAVEDAQRSLQRAQRDEVYAAQDVARAVKEATRAYADLQLQTSGAALSQERAAIQLERAQERLQAANDAGLGAGLDRRELELDVKEAQQSLSEAGQRYKNLSEDSAEWARTGVMGSQQVQSALRSLQSAQEAVGDAARQASRAQEDGARSVADAQIALAEAAQQAGWAQEDAARGVADAQAALSEAQQSAAWANEDAARQVADAQRALADAYTDAGQAGVKGADEAAYALSKLSPAGREFVRFWTQEWSPAVDRVTHATAEEMLPRVERAMRNLLGVEPELTAGLSSTAAVLGDVAVRGSELAASAPFRSDFVTIMSGNTEQLRSYGNAGLNLFGALTDLAAVASPYSSAFARVVDLNSQAFESWVLSARASGELDAILRNGQATLDWLVSELGSIAGGLWNTAQGFAPLGGAALTALADVSQFIGGIAGWNPTLTSLVGGTALAAIGVGKLAAALRVASATGWIAGLQSAAGVLGTVLNPAALLATGKVQALGVATTSAAGKLGLGATAATRLGTAAAGMAAGFPLAVAALTGLYIATESLTVSQDEAVSAMERGGTAAEQARQKIAEQNGAVQDQNTWVGRVNKSVNEWIGSTTGLWTTQDEATAALQRYRDGLSPVERAQSLLKEAQGDYNKALSDAANQQTPAVIAAHQRLVEANQNVERAQDDTRRAIMSATDALRDQQDTMVAGINARLQYEQSVRSTQRAQQDYARVLRETPGDAAAVADALGTLEQAQLRQFEAAQKAGEAAAKANPALDANAEANRRGAQAVGEMVAATNGPLTGALADMVQHLDGAGLAAAGARVEVDKAGRSVAVFPSGRTVVLDANISPAVQQANMLRDQINALVGSIRVDANGQPADASSRALMDRINATIATMHIAGDPGPGDGSLWALAQRVQATTSAMHLAGDPLPAQGDTEALKGWVAAQWSKINDAANTDPAMRDTLARLGWINAQWGTVNVKADVSQLIRNVGDAILHLPGASPLNPITLYVQSQQVRAPGDLSPRRAGGGLITGYAGGGAIDEIGGPLNGYAAGGPVRSRRTGRPPGGARPSGRDDTVIRARRGEFMLRDVVTDNVGVAALGMLNRVEGRRDGAAVASAIGSALNPMPTPRVQGMAGGGLSSPRAPIPVRPLGFATGGSVEITPHRYDTAARVAREPAAMATEVDRSGQPGSSVTINQSFANDKISARDGFEAASRAIALRATGGVHAGSAIGG